MSKLKKFNRSEDSDSLTPLNKVTNKDWYDIDEETKEVLAYN